MNHCGTELLTTKRLTLRRFEPEDAQSVYYHFASESPIMQAMDQSLCPSAAKAEERLLQTVSSYERADVYVWAVECNETEELIGTIFASAIHEETQSVILSGCIGSAFQNEGYGTEALTRVLLYFLDDVSACRVSAWCDANNEAAEKTYVGAGMSYEGTLLHCKKTQSGFCDVTVYAKLRSEDETGESLDLARSGGTQVQKVVGSDGVAKNVISDETMDYVGILAKLELTKEEEAAAKRDMEEMLDYIDQLNELDTTGVEPLSHVFAVHNVFREDVVTNGDGYEATLANAPQKRNGGFSVPKTIGE